LGAAVSERIKAMLSRKVLAEEKIKGCSGCKKQAI
jgi:hypothetical protein